VPEKRIFQEKEILLTKEREKARGIRWEGGAASSSHEKGEVTLDLLKRREENRGKAFISPSKTSPKKIRKKKRGNRFKKKLTFTQLTKKAAEEKKYSMFL